MTSQRFASKDSLPAFWISFPRNAHCVRTIQTIAQIAALWGLMSLLALAESGIPGARVPEVSFATEPYNYMADSWYSREDLPLDTIRALSETPDGYLWVGTSEGLVWFDGTSFHFYTRKEVPALGNMNIDCLLASKDGSLWIGTEGGGLVHFQNGFFRRYLVDSGPETDFVRGLYQDSGGVIWVATDAGLFRVRGDHLERGNVELGIPVFNSNAIIEDHVGRRWIGGYRLFASVLGKATEYLLPQKDAGSQIKSLLETRDGSIWVGTIEGLYRASPGSKRFSRVPGITGTVLTLLEAASGELWVGSTIGGIYRVRCATVAHLGEPDTHISNVVLFMFRDSNQNIWIGTQAGITRLSRSPMHRIDPLGNQDLAIGSVSLDSDGSLWFAANKLAHIQGGKVTPVHFPSIEGANVRNLLRPRDRSLWIGTNGKGLYHITSSSTRHYDVSNGLVYNNVRSLTEARDGSLWVGTDNGVSHLDARGFHNLTEADGLAYNSIRTIIEDREGDIWIGTDHGVSHLRNGSFVRDASTQALSNKQVWALCQDSDGGMWFGTQGDGLYGYFHGSIAHYTTSSGLVSDIIYSILEDGKNRLWVSTPSAVMMMDRKELSHPANDSTRPIPMRVFSGNEGGRPTRFYGGFQPSGVLLRNGDGCFPSSHGIWIIHPDLNIQPYRVHLNIESLSVDGHTVPVADSVDIAANNNRVEIIYALVLLGSQQEWRFQYMLDGFDKNWMQTFPGQRSVSYTNLPPERYRFHIESWDVHHPERKFRTSFSIVKKPFIYQTLGFRVAVALLFIALLALAYYLRIKHLDSKFRAIAEERARIAREMHDTLLQGCASVSALLNAASDDDAGDSASRLHLIQHASTEIRSTMDEAREAISGLRADAPKPLDLVQSISHMTERNARKYGVDSTLQVSGEPFEMSQSTSRALAMVVREAVFNAILHGDTQSIRITIAFSLNELLIEVADDGQGFLVSASYAEDDYGLKGMRERVDGLGGTIHIDSTQGKGTSVRVHMPRDRA
jgi:ligand-binding sensor domain-containing protein/signal transduction histidine kinase